MTYEEIIKRLEGMSDPESIEGMERFGITPGKTFGVRIPDLRQLGKEIGKDHQLARRLWEGGYRETRILAGLVEERDKVSEEQLERWAADFDYWEICDQTIMNLIEKTSFAWNKAFQWSIRNEESYKRAGFVLMARLAVSDKKSDDEKFLDFFPLIISESGDNRNLVKKAVNWALRQIGKRSLMLNKYALEAIEEIKSINSKAAHWIAADAYRELRNRDLWKRLKAKEESKVKDDDKPERTKEKRVSRHTKPKKTGKPKKHRKGR